jgi:outer membrane protein TolC
MNRILFILGICVLSVQAVAQPVLTIEDCYAQARENYPLVKQRDLISKSNNYSLANATKGYLPQLTVFGQASYQSDVTQVPISAPGVVVLDKDQYKIYGEINQTLYDGGVISKQKKSIEANTAVEEQKLEVELYKIKDRINQLFFGILMLNEQIVQTEILKKDVQAGLAKTNAAIANGSALKSSGDALQAELLKADQRAIELKALRSAYRDMLGLFINKQLDETATFEKPQLDTPTEIINRPELKMYDFQKKSLDAQNEMITAKNLPKFGLFFQGGYGRPALNMLNNDFDTYYIGGLRMTWSLGGLYTSKNERAIIDVSRNSLELQRETFLFNTNLTLKQQNTEVSKLQELIKTDDEIIALRARIKNSALAQVENGVITSNDYIREANAEDQARQNQALHQIQLLMTYYNQQTTAGY